MKEPALLDEDTEPSLNVNITKKLIDSSDTTVIIPTQSTDEAVPQPSRAKPIELSAPGPTPVELPTPAPTPEELSTPSLTPVEFSPPEPTSPDPLIFLASLVNKMKKGSASEEPG